MTRIYLMFVSVAFAILIVHPTVSGQGREDPAARARWRFQQRAGADGTIPADALLKAKEQMDCLREASPPRMDAGISEWEWLGPSNIGGRIRTILIHPTSPNIMWIGSVSGGIWRTNNAGASWFPLTDFMANSGVTSIVMDPTNFNIMYASTGEGFFPGSSAPQGAGIFKSSDGGLTWNQLAATSNFILVNRLAHHPTVANTLLAAVASPRGIYRSTDGGATWTPALVLSEMATDVKYHPVFPNNVLAGTATDLYFSSNGGTTWARQTTGAGGKLPNSPGRCEVAFSRSTGNMYASLNRNGGELWWGSAGAQTWTLMNTGTNYLGTQGSYNNAIWMDPVDPDVLIVGGIDLWRSTNGGTTLRKISRWQNYHNGGPQNSAHADQHAIVHHPGFNGTTNRIVYFGNDGGIQVALDAYAVDSTAGWTNLANNLGITQFYGGAAAPNGSLIVGGTQDNSILHYTPPNGIHNWRQPETGDGGFAAIDPINNNRVYGEHQYLDFVRSDNGGISYASKISGLGDAGNRNLAAFIAPCVMDPNDPSTLVAGGKRIWRTTNAGESWSQIRDSLSDGQLCSAIEIALVSSNIIWVGYSGGRVSRTFNGGDAWLDVTAPGLPTGRVVTDIAINPSNAAEVVITYGGYQNRSVWLTTNGGLDWVLREGTAPFNLPEIHINTVRYNPTNTNWIYVGTDLGVLASEDKGITWNVTPRFASHEGPVNVAVDELFWQGSNHLIAATHGRGMFRARILSTVYVDITNTGTEDGTLLHPYRTIQAAINAAGSGSTISIAAGVYPQAPLIFWKRGLVESRNGIVQIIGPATKPVLPEIKEAPLTPTVPNKPERKNE